MTKKSIQFNRRQLLTGAATLAVAPWLIDGQIQPIEAKAPMLGPKQPKHARFKLGDFELTNIVDSESFIDGPYPLIGKNATEQEVRTLMQQNFLPETKYQPGFTPTVLNTGNELILFDTGNGDNGFIPQPAGGWLARQLLPASIKPEQIDIVVLTHGHPDHVGGLIMHGKTIYPNARYVISQIEYDFWTAKNKHSGDIEKFAKVFLDNTQSLNEKFSFIKPGDDVATGVTAVEAYGHTPGQLAFHIESNGNQAFLWADCAHHHVASLARPDWHCVFDVDPEQGAKTRAKIFDMVATDKLTVLGYHMPFPSIGYVEKLNDQGFRWIQHSFQLK